MPDDPQSPSEPETEPWARPDDSPEPMDMIQPLFREESLPPEGGESPQVWLWMLIFGILLFCTLYLGLYVGDFSPDPWLQSPEPVAQSGAAPPTPAPVSGSQVYSSRCATCHQSNGQGVSGAFPTLVGTEWVEDEGRIIRILLRSGQALLDLARVEAVALDKTGTLSTLPSPSVEVVLPEAVPAGRSPGPARADVLRRAAAVERGTNHALATALVEAAEEHDLSVPTVRNGTTHAGAGVTGTVVEGSTSRRVGVGNRALLDTLGIRPLSRLADRARDATQRGKTVLYVVEDERVTGLLTLEEPPVPRAADALAALRDATHSVSVLTGDRPAAAARLSDALDVPAEASLSPSDKIDRLQALREEQGPVAMVGDGINDAAALAEADVGIALSSGASVSMEAADITLYPSDLRLVPWLHTLARRTDRIVRQNLWWTFGYNAVGLGLAVFGLLHPIAAVVVMTGSSLLVTANAFRLRRGAGPADVVGDA
jgi:cation transport ATPase